MASKRENSYHGGKAKIKGFGESPNASILSSMPFYPTKLSVQQALKEAKTEAACLAIFKACPLFCVHDKETNAFYRSRVAALKIEAKSKGKNNQKSIFQP